MARQGGGKRDKERARQQKQKDKAAVRAERKKNKDTRADVAPGEDPDVAGIVPGPQAPIEA